MASTAQKCKEVLLSHYGDRLAGVLLFGSSARGDGSPESDLDLLVLLQTPLDYFGELRSLSDLLYPVQLEEERLISAKPAAVDAFERGEIQLYRNAKREGLML